MFLLSGWRRRSDYRKVAPCFRSWGKRAHKHDCDRSEAQVPEEDSVSTGHQQQREENVDGG